MDWIRELGVLALDHRCRRMTETLLRTAEEVYRALGLEFRPRWASTFLLLEREGPLPVTEIAQRLRLTHPGIIGITDEMNQAGLVTEVKDRGDGRRRLIGLTPAARRLRPALQRVWDELALVQRRRFAAAGCDIIAVLNRVEDGVAKRSMTSEIVEKLGRRRPPARRAARAAGLLLALGIAPSSAAPVAQAQAAGAGINVEVVRSVSKHLVSGYIDEALGRIMADSLEGRLRAGGLQSLPPRALADSVTALLFRLSHDPHLGLHHDRAPAPAATPSAEPAPPVGPGADLGFCRVDVLADSIGYIDLCGFSDAPEALAYADSVMATLGGANALIIDLRGNRGGGPQMVRLLSTYMFDQPTHLVSTFIRGMSAPRERWTLEQVRGRRFTRVPVYLLTSRRTISAAESFAFGLRINRKITMVGEPTAGGGHFGEILDLPGGFSMFLPHGRTFDPRTGQGWEATGLAPDVGVPAREALATALRLIREPE
jgi:DNA-binding MarR family transcriptional regulator